MGHKGIVRGNLFLEDDKEEFYLVLFEGDDSFCLTLKYKLNKY